MIDQWGNERIREEVGRLNRTKHSRVLSVLEKRALRYKNKGDRPDRRWSKETTTAEINSIDETGTVDTASLTDDDSVNTNDPSCELSTREKELIEACGVSDELLQVHGVAPGSKQEGVVRLIYENLNGLLARLSNNEKLDKARGLIHDLEADIVCYNEHRLNLTHKDNKNGFSQLFRGGEADIRSVAAHNTHEAKVAGRIQEGGVAALLFGPLIAQYDIESSGKDELGLGRWVMLVFKGENDITTRVIVAYNSCYNKNKNATRCSYQQQRRYFITKEKDTTCPRTRFKTDLFAKLDEWRENGDRLIVCMDANEDIYKKQIGRRLTDEAGLNMSEVVGDFTGEDLGATYFRGTKPIDGVWATRDIGIVGACVMPVGFGVGDHRLFVIDIQVASMIGAAPPKIERAPARRLNNKIPRVAERYTKTLEKLYVEHRMNTRLVEIHATSKSDEEAKHRTNKLDTESTQYRRNAEKKCRKIRSGRIPFSPEASIWIRRNQVYESLLKYKQGKIKNRSNLRRAAQRCGIKAALKLSIAEINERLKLCNEKMEYFCRHGQRYRRKHLKNRLSIARAKQNRKAEQQILEIIRRERERSFWRRLNYSMAKSAGKSVRVVQKVTEDGTVLEATTQREVENAIWDEIHGKRFYIAEQAPICQGKLRGEFGYFANTEAAKAVLDGTYVYDDEMHCGTKELLQEAHRIRQIIPPDSVDCTIGREAWQKKWSKAKETTSSSESQIHYGHYIAGAQSDIISHHDALKTTICLKRGFALDRWERGLSCMLEKLAGCCLLDKLRAILLMEADFNANNKIIYGTRMLNNVRKYGLMADEIFSEVGRTADDGALCKVLYYDIVRQSRLTAAIASVDASNCYDSIAHAIALLIFQACGVTLESIESMLDAIQNMKYFLRTAFGDSKNFRGSKVEVKFQGLCQGNGAAPAGWAVISITILNAHKRKGHGTTFVCPVTKNEVKLAAILYVDDCDLIHLDMNCEDSAFVTYEKMQESVLNWGNLLIGSGGAYKPIKCFYHLISFSWNSKGEWTYEDNHNKPEFEMVVPLPDGTEAAIDHLPVTESKKTLGVWTSPTGCAKGALTAMRTKAQDWVDRAKEGKLRQRDIWFLLDCQFWPSVGFGLCCNLASALELEKCLSKQYYKLLPLGGVIRTAPALIRQLGKGFFGPGCPDPCVECCVEQTSKLLAHFGCPSNVGKTMEISYNKLVIELGLSTQPLQRDFKKFGKWVTWGWLAALWEKCSIYGVTVKFNVETVRLQRERDRWLMEEFVRLGYGEKELRILNRVRVFMQVIFLSDVLGVSGRTLDTRYLSRRPRGVKWSTLSFPQEKPTSADFQLWKSALQQLVPAGGLRVHLGRFLHEGYKIWEWRLSAEENLLLRCKGHVMDVYQPRAGSSRHWTKQFSNVDIENIGTPCSVRESRNESMVVMAISEPHIAETLPNSFHEVIQQWGYGWLWSSLKLVGSDDWILDAIRNGSCIAVADGSYIPELSTELCSCAFVLECTEGRGRLFGSFPEPSKTACAYRGELLGLLAIHLILLAVNRIDEKLAGIVKIYSDCLGALTKTTSLPDNRLPSGCKHADVLKILMVHCSKFSFDCDYLHVEAHQDERKRYSQLSRPAQLNCCMDTNAKNVLWALAGETPPTQEMLPLESVAVFVGKEKMTSGSEDLLRFWCQRVAAREILSAKKVKVLEREQFDVIDWTSVYGALNEVPRMFQIWACKQVLNIAGTNEMQARYTPDFDKLCPSCHEEIETCHHVLSCEEEGRVELLLNSIQLVDMWMKDHGTDSKLRKYLTLYAKGRGGTTMGEIVGLEQGKYRQLARSMDIIGWRRFMEGMIPKEVIEIQKVATMESKHSVSLRKWSIGLVTRLLEVTHGQWLYRNVKVHDSIAGDLASRRKEEIKKALLDQMELGREGLAEEDWYLLEINLNDLESSSGEDQAYWLLALKAARAAAELRSEGQRQRQQRN